MKSVLIISSMIIFGVLFLPTVSAQLVPEWVKTNAGWWAEGNLDDQTFKNGIQFLVTEKIILVPSTTLENNDLESMPKWIKNNAKWWAEGQISETVFLNAIQYLVKTGTIKIDIDISKHMVEGFSSIDEINAAKAKLTDSERLIFYDKLFPFMSGYRGAAFDGKYVYFAPYYNNYGRHNVVMQYDTTQPFDNPDSWNPFAAPTIGFQGAVYHDGNVYFVPYFVDKGDSGSLIMKYDTKMDFYEYNSWDLSGYYDVYEDGISVGNNLYLSPHFDYKNEKNTFPLRIETSNSDVINIEKIDLEIHASFIGAAFDGKKIYYAPWESDDQDGTSIMIYDTEKPFLEKSSWDFISIPYIGYSGAGFNGTHVVFAPCYCITHSNTSESGRIMFLNVNTQEITYSTSDHDAYNGVIEAGNTLYLVADINQNGIRSDFVEITNSIKRFSPSIATGGYWGGVFDGQYVYYSPYDEITLKKKNSEFLRYDTSKPFDNNASWKTVSFLLTDFKPYTFGQPYFIND